MSKIEVNTVEPQCGTTVTVGKCTSTIAIPGNVVKSNALQASDGGNIVSQSGTDITLGASGDTINLASGASQSGFGRTGTVDWITTPKVTGDSPVTGVTGKGYFMNTTAGTITLNLPAGSAGDIISLMDYAATWDSNKVTVSPNGSEKIGSVNADVDLTTVGQSVTLVYVDSTQGWLNTMDSTSNIRASDTLVATGGTPCAGAISGDYRIHTFTGPGTFCVSSVSGTPACNVVDYLVVAGGGGGGSMYGGGGGAGGYRESVPSPAAWTGSPLANPGNARPVSVQGYPIVIGAAGTATPGAQNAGGSGGASSFSDIPSAGGGGAAAECAASLSGGSGGGGSYSNAASAGNTPPVSPAQGFGGGTGGGAAGYGAGGGGGATAAGACGSPSAGGGGGAGGTTCISASPTDYGGGGGGAGENIYTPGPGGSGGGGAGAPSPTGSGVAGTTNSGGGGGGGNNPQKIAGAGGSGIVILRYKFQ